ncbi:MAG: hypothetical protein KDA84_21875, partial [Planctomycetaceae bacterium]|nr:hypothetical protein [Planctomycetaceae bacterium]
ALLAVLCYLTRVLLDASGRKSDWATRWNRVIWTIGCAVLWLHIAAAFHFVHQWSHESAVRQTAEQTGDLTGWYWGGGVYINYALALFWLGDVIAWWRKGLDYPQRSPKRFWITHAIFGFLVFNATVVFGPVYWKAIGLLCLGWLSGLGISRTIKR